MNKAQSMRNAHLRLSHIQKRARRKAQVKMGYKRLEVSVTKEEMIVISKELIIKSNQELSFVE
ncbi:hypothetical protein VHA01S_031_00600 [Vibrio halioticoli NBRC 102217]|uniref:Uncharacterized protein n=1 Tax=Vibrio halioticoli NBRC 102217 TaxID=1219072 RepID=V5FEE8_9VIBR|nr:hypothetical protein [Vibrio halioticoli]GAD90048.1 hypothetical protein VHA01S_031_00600 [Vibrio halioticoli NBRC 102217]